MTKPVLACGVQTAQSPRQADDLQEVCAVSLPAAKTVVADPMRVAVVSRQLVLTCMRLA